jgi:beta-carotene hydroxylase
MRTADNVTQGPADNVTQGTGLTRIETASIQSVPPLRELGEDLLRTTPLRRGVTLAVPFLCTAAYFVCALRGYWPLAVLAVMALSFFTYGSTSHDLVHRTLGLRRWANDLLLSATELLCLRSGHAYQAAHLYHHAQFPAEDDVEGASARMSFWRTLLEGPIYQIRIWPWALRRAGSRERALILAEGACCLGLFVASVLLLPRTPVPFVYAALAVMGSWIFPLITAHLQHYPQEKDPLFQTRTFRGIGARIVALDHLYHLEHHLYPAVPHQHWPRLAERLDPYLAKAGVRPSRLWL